MFPFRQSNAGAGWNYGGTRRWAPQLAVVPLALLGYGGLVEGIAARVAVHAAETSRSTEGGMAAWLSAALWYPNIAGWC